MTLREGLSHEIPLGLHILQTDTFVETLGYHEYRSNHIPPGLALGDLQGHDLELVFNTYLTDEAYAESLSSLVIKCVDIAVVNENDEMLIGTRCAEPQAGDWVIGGRMRAGETVLQTARRNLGRELHAKPEELDTVEIRKVGEYSFIWDSRAQGSTVSEKNQLVIGCHTSSDLVMYTVKSDQVDLSNFDQKEYDRLAWVSPLDIIETPEGSYHPCLVAMAFDTLNILTNPSDPQDIDERRLRAVWGIATLQKDLRELSKDIQ